ncbi:hypothetical protein BJV74DRAFT_627395 [Russula compacta]|nr:hypothetical protein BJV74DRAFT_627395 [Russula compacta]
MVSHCLGAITIVANTGLLGLFYACTGCLVYMCRRQHTTMGGSESRCPTSVIGQGLQQPTATTEENSGNDHHGAHILNCKSISLRMIHATICKKL